MADKRINDSRKTVIVAVSGGIAAYKAVTVASKLFQAGYDVQVILSKGAQEFVQPLTFSAVTRRKVLVDIFPDDEAEEGEELFPHLYPASHADVFISVPSTATWISRVARGMADDITSAAVLPLPRYCRRYFCPAMNASMWENPVVQENARMLRENGWQQIGPDEGIMACGDMGYGRMTEPEDIIKQLLSDLSTPPLLAGKRILILSGPTRERIDPVRFISNDSSGKMGKALALAAANAGAEVEFVTGPVQHDNLPRAPRIVIHEVETAIEMLDAANELFSSCDGAVFAAAVADFRPAVFADKKLEKDGLEAGIPMILNPDIAKTLGEMKRADQVCIGFALQTHDGLIKARQKLQSKNLDSIILNGPDSFGAASGTFTVVTADTEYELGMLSKQECASHIVTLLAGEASKTSG